MPIPFDVDPATFAFALESALARLVELGQPGLDAFNEMMATRGECPDFHAGVDLLDRWLSIAAAADQTGSP